MFDVFSFSFFQLIRGVSCQIAWQEYIPLRCILHVGTFSVTCGKKWSSIFFPFLCHFHRSREYQLESKDLYWYSFRTKSLTAFPDPSSIIMIQIMRSASLWCSPEFRGIRPSKTLNNESYLLFTPCRGRYAIAGWRSNVDIRYWSDKLNSKGSSFWQTDFSLGTFF